MATDHPSIKHLWADQATEGFAMSLDDIRMRSSKFQRLVRNRNLREYLAAVVVVAVFGAYIVLLPGILIKLGSAMMIVATFYIVWQLHKRGAAHTPPLEGSVLDHIAFYRGELVRQRDALKSVATWYLAPFVPGMVTILIGVSLRAPTRPLIWLSVSVTAVLCVIVFGLVWWLNRWGASRLQRQIDALERIGQE